MKPKKVLKLSLRIKLFLILLKSTTFAFAEVFFPVLLEGKANLYAYVYLLKNKYYSDSSE